MIYPGGMLVAGMKQHAGINLVIFVDEQPQVQPQPYEKGGSNRRTLKCVYEIKPTRRFYPSLPEKSIHRLLGTRSPPLAWKCHCT